MALQVPNVRPSRPSNANFGHLLRVTASSLHHQVESRSHVWGGTWSPCRIVFPKAFSHLLEADSGADNDKPRATKAAGSARRSVGKVSLNSNSERKCEGKKEKDGSDNIKMNVSSPMKYVVKRKREVVRRHLKCL